MKLGNIEHYLPRKHISISDAGKLSWDIFSFLFYFILGLKGTRKNVMRSIVKERDGNGGRNDQSRVYLSWQPKWTKWMPLLSMISNERKCIKFLFYFLWKYEALRYIINVFLPSNRKFHFDRILGLLKRMEPSICC